MSHTIGVSVQVPIVSYRSATAGDGASDIETVAVDETDIAIWHGVLPLAVREAAFEFCVALGRILYYTEEH